ncbi:unnamed protein product [Brassica napus]|uniref:(rape) hypothetical protein n=1 Tax=Brassica napus TaxID=3708 RepID=A0A816MA59_BRANA|nr:unnamed protein product [Brassica napus]
MTTLKFRKRYLVLDKSMSLHVNNTAHVLLVLAYKIKLVEVPETVFRVTRTLEQNATEVVHRWQHVAPELPEEIFIRTTMEVVNGTVSSQKTVRATFLALFLGDASTLLSILNRRLPELSLITFLNRFQESIWRKMIELETPAAIAFNPYGGMMAKISPTATPFPYRAGNLCKIQYVTDWGEDRLTKLTRKLYRFMTPFVSKNPRQSFFNYRDIELRTNFSQNQELC